MARRSAPIFAVLFLLACSRPRPSPEYERARALWAGLVRTHPAEPAEAPGVDEVLELLDAVGKGSSDAAAAAELRDRILRERQEAAAQRSRREDLARRAGTPMAMHEGPPRNDGAAPSAPATPQPPAVPALAVGMKLDEFRAVYGPCFSLQGPVQIDAPGGPPRPGEMWSMRDDDGCRTSHPALVGQVVLLADGAVAGVSPVAAVKRVEVRKNVQLAPLPDGTTGMVVDGAVVPLPPGAKVVPSPGAAP